MYFFFDASNNVIIKWYKTPVIKQKITTQRNVIKEIKIKEIVFLISSGNMFKNVLLIKFIQKLN